MIADAMISRTDTREDRLALRPALPQDSVRIWVWRNDYATRSHSQTAAPIPWPEHDVWYRKALQSTDRQLLIAEAAGVPVAAVRFDKTDRGGFEVSINLAPSARNSGLGGRILAQACSTFRSNHEGVGLFATIHRDNPASRRIFEKLGFAPSSALSDSSFERYELAGGTGE